MMIDKYMVLICILAVLVLLSAAWALMLAADEIREDINEGRRKKHGYR